MAYQFYARVSLNLLNTRIRTVGEIYNQATRSVQPRKIVENKGIMAYYIRVMLIVHKDGMESTRGRGLLNRNKIKEKASHKGPARVVTKSRI